MVNKIRKLLFIFLVFFPILKLLSVYVVGLPKIYEPILMLISVVLVIIENKTVRYWIMFFLQMLVLFFIIINVFREDSYIEKINLFRFITLFNLLILAGKNSFLMDALKFINKFRNIIILQMFVVFFFLWVMFITKKGFYYFSPWQMTIFNPYSQIMDGVSHDFVYHLIYLYLLIKNIKVSKLVEYFSIISILIFAFFTGARTPFVVLLLLILLINKLYKNKLFWIISIILVPLVLTFDSFWSSPMVQKILITSENGQISNGRDSFYLIGIKDFITNFNIIEKLIGKGVNYDRKLLYYTTGLKIWSHNDFINIALTSGLLGIFMYIYAFNLYFKMLFKKAGFFHTAYICVIFMSLAFFNGLYVYQDSSYYFVLIILIYFSNLRNTNMEK
ncbi:hypothetical protein BED47_16830 [Gottfriedia luciferensis]|uniref:O-antigen polymerase n=1 Tax=Gottfriedia luciferensis TaxID=178774 RepID=A0ABX2ZTZ4_9BACI|nr:hypothetical protein [Gottfriedia luciferensis]ODG93167.1 hypothetical protein BED47_16830 [Gottfriedia luciferensis]